MKKPQKLPRVTRAAKVPKAIVPVPVPDVAHPLDWLASTLPSMIATLIGAKNSEQFAWEMMGKEGRDVMRALAEQVYLTVLRNDISIAVGMQLAERYHRRVKLQRTEPMSDATAEAVAMEHAAYAEYLKIHFREDAPKEEMSQGAPGPASN